ncbi:TRAP transporter small permease [Hoeflea ulvae]|uniref:TRAP transporter small permease protein n=1 Tax=Hoeflea ulvae TaxID=2983764 RepID=A0ABT3YGW8_9HYPH|nr:TRAP transporter small permease [Hoeflea ulvae]MCY0095141.1 TRAP transporter small permease [Hoeflea ulvae]
MALQTVKRLLNLLWRFIDIVMAVLMGLMICLVFTNVVLRYGFSSGLRPSVELSRLGFVWIVMLGSVVVLRRGEHLAISDVAEGLFPRLVPVLQKISWAVILLSVSLLFWGATKQALANWNNMSQLTGLPKGLLYVPGGIAGFLMMFIALKHIFFPNLFKEDEQQP